MDYSKSTREELVAYCKAQKIKGYSTKTKGELIELLLSNAKPAVVIKTVLIPTTLVLALNAPAAPLVPAPLVPAPLVPVKRLNYIGSKFQLLEWINTHMQEKTGWSSFQEKRIADLFAGTGIVSHHFRMQNACVFSNDAELYSAVITHAFTRSAYTNNCAALMQQLQAELVANKHSTTVGFITEKYSPYNGNERMFFTVDNAQRIDYLRQRIEDLKLSEIDEYKFLVASLLLSADAVSNVPAVYGCYLKNFKAKALKTLLFTPIHTIASASASSMTFNLDILSDELLKQIPSLDIVYLDPPYNERQYSKNYFPLNMIALTPDRQRLELPLKGKTGIPESCFLSPFCRKGKPVEEAFERLFKQLKTHWLFLSYNSESIVSKEKMLELMGKYGTVTVIEKPYKRFKSFDYNKDKEIFEYLFCLEKI